MTREKILKYAPRIIFISLFFGLSFYLYFFSSTEKMVSSIGVENAYLLMFVLAFIGGMSTFTAIPYHLVLITLATGGLNSFLLGASTAVGVMCGDTTSYFLGYQGSAIIPQSFQRILNAIRRFGLKYPRILPIFFFLYGALSPFSNDFIVVSMGLSRYPYWKVMIPLGLGNLVFNITLAYFSLQAYGLLKGIFF
ncbi:MAG: hypothetical protein PHF35_03520 [Candidatus Moranbacteria bacterium]|nr:hypothetical protein [Candidatus Moranbacteria bacterium]